MDIRLALSPETRARRRRWIARLRALTDPVTSRSDPDRRRARLLAWMLLSLFLLLSLTLVVVFFADRAGDPARGIYDALLVGLMLTLGLAYLLNHLGHYAVAAGLVVACAFVGPWGSVALDRSILNGNFVPLIYTMLSVFLCSLLLSARITAVLAVIQFVALLLIPLLSSATAAINWASLLSFVFFTSVLCVVTNIVREQDLDQIERQTRQLAEDQVLLREQSVRDPLTGLFNRRYLEETLERELQRAARYQHPVGILLVDIDHFKRWNDTYGHAVGDALLRAMGPFLRGQLRLSDIACRYGGDELVLVLPEVPLETLCERAEQIRQAAKQLHVQAEGQCFDGPTLSMGLAIFPEHGSTSDAVLKSADLALYRAKREGRDRVVVAGA